MLNTVELCYFSPTGGTKRAGELLAGFLAENVTVIDMGCEKAAQADSCQTAVIAVPVFGGRIPSFAADWLKGYQGSGKKAVTIAVYGNRAYEDALLELNDIVEASGAQIVASGALVAQHSIAPQVAAGRPDAQDEAEIREFAQETLKKLESGQTAKIQVPGNRPYKASSPMSATPISLPSCSGCGTCEKVCPVNAIQVTDKTVSTDSGKCMLCMACVARCPEKARILPPSLQEKLGAMLGQLKDLCAKNQWFV